MGNFTNWLRDVLMERGVRLGGMKDGTIGCDTQRKHRDNTYSLLRPLDDKSVVGEANDLPVAHRYSA